jgi:hypothetical protein
VEALAIGRTGGRFASLESCHLPENAKEKQEKGRLRNCAPDVHAALQDNRHRDVQFIATNGAKLIPLRRKSIGWRR